MASSALGAAAFHSGPVGDSGGPGNALARSPQLLVAFEGRIDNAGALIADLGDLLTERSPADILLACWDKWGPECVDRLVGDFTLAAFDAAEGTLTLACDITQQRSLFYTVRGNGDVLFATAASVLPEPGGAIFDTRVLATLVAGEDSGDWSPFAGVKSIRAGQLVVIRSGRISARTYWTPSLVEEPRLRGAVAVEAWRALIGTAVRDRLGDSDVVATHLSSGYDSSAVTATAAMVADPSRLYAFTAAPVGPVLQDAGRHRFADESALAALTAQQLGIHHRIIRSDAPLIPAWRTANRLNEFPNFLPVNQGWWLSIREQAAALGASTLLCGEMGNDSLNSPGLPMLAEFVRRGHWRRWLAESKALRRNELASWRGILFNSLGPGLDRRLWEWLRDRHMTKGSYCTRFLHRDTIGTLDPPTDPRPSAAPYADRVEYILGADFRGQRRAGVIQCGILEADPLADKRLIEFSLSLPPDAFLAEGKLRPLARAALADRLPAEVLELKRRGLQGTDWPYRLTKTVLAEVADEIRSSPTNRQLLDFEEIDRVIAGWPDDVEEIYRQKILYEVQLVRALSVGLFVSIFEEAK